MSSAPFASMGDFPLRASSARRSSPSRLALVFFSISLGVVLAATLLAGGLMWGFGRSVPERFKFPAAFAISTLLLVVGSVTMQQALGAVRREKQERFRGRLLAGLVTAAAFMGVQSYALWSILPAERSSDAASLGAAPFVLVLATLHGLHFLVATLFVSYVTSRALAGRYDHEYHWGVSVCAWFWHALGIVWLAILAVYTIVAA
jgi:cytochrome c oxidase subunit 3